MPTYNCFEGAPWRSGLAYGHKAQLIYIRDYKKDPRSGPFVSLVHDEQVHGYCTTHGVVPVWDQRNRRAAEEEDRPSSR